MTDRLTWYLLAERLATIRRLREEKEEQEKPIELIFDKDDQARLA